MVGLFANTIDRWIAHVHVWRGHVNLRPQDVLTFGKAKIQLKLGAVGRELGRRRFKLDSA